MASTAVEVAILLTAKDAASAALSKVGGEVDKLGKASQALKVGLGVATAGIGIAVAALVDFGRAAAEEQVGIARLEQAIANTGKETEITADILEHDLLPALERTTAFSDGEMRDSLSMLTAQTGDVDEAFYRMNLAMDLARGTGMDLAVASKLLGKVTDETTSALGRYGITVEKGATATDLLNKVQEKFGGQAAKFAETAAGQWQIFQNQVDNLKEDLGSALLPIATAVFGKLIDFIDAIRNNKGIQEFGARIRDVVDILSEMFGVITGSAPDAGAKLTDAVGPERAKEIMRALADVRETIKSLIDTIKELVDWFQSSSKESETLRGLLGFLAEQIGGGLSTAFRTVTGYVSGFVNLIEKAIEFVGRLWEKLRGLGDFFGGISAQVNGFIGGGGGGGFFAAANGFSGVVTKPTLFLAGESGPEEVNIGATGQGSSNVTVTGNTFYVREESDIERIAEALDDLARREQRRRGITGMAA
jgi:hypothetical protein